MEKQCGEKAMFGGTEMPPWWCQGGPGGSFPVLGEEELVFLFRAVVMYVGKLCFETEGEKP